MAMIVNIFACEKNDEPSLIQGREIETGGNSVTPKVIIFEDRAFPRLNGSERIQPYIMSSDNLDTQLKWNLHNYYQGPRSSSSVGYRPINIEPDLSSRLGVRPGPIFYFGGTPDGDGMLTTLFARYYVFKEPPPPGNWTLHIKLVGNINGKKDYRDASYLENRIMCDDDLSAEKSQDDLTVNKSKSISGMIMNQRPSYSPNLPIDPNGDVFQPIDYSLSIGPEDVAGCSRVYFELYVNNTSERNNLLRFQFNQLELQMVYNGAYQEPERFTKFGNNGATYCANYCGSQVWDPSAGVGVCVSSEAEGRSFGCFEAAWEILGHQTHQFCTCQKLKYETVFSPSAKSCHRECLEMGKGLCLSANRDQQFLNCKEIHENKTCVCASRY